MKVLVLADHWGALGGGEVVADQLARALTTQHQVTVLTTDRERDAVERHGDLTVYRVRSNYPLRLRPLAGIANPLVLPALRRVLDKVRPDLVHAWNVHQHLSYASLALARQRGVPVVLTYQDALPFCYTKYHCYIERGAPCPARPAYRADPARCPSCWRPYWLFPPRNRLARLLLRRSVSAPVAVSQALADALSDNGLPGARVIHNGLPLEEFPAAPDAVAAVGQRYRLGAEAIIAGGRMGFFKGQLLLLEAFARLAPRRPAAQLVLAGRDDDWFGAELHRRVDRFGLADRVRFVGFLPRPEFIALLGAGALFANLSIYLDPFPTVNLETAAAGRPVLGTCYGGTPEVVLDGETGRLVNPHRPDEVVEALEALLGDAQERARLGLAAARWIGERFELGVMVKRYLALFSELTRA